MAETMQVRPLPDPEREESMKRFICLCRVCLNAPDVMRAAEGGFYVQCYHRHKAGRRQEPVLRATRNLAIDAWNMKQNGRRVR